MPISSCRCGLPSANASWEVAPTQVVQLDCRNWYAAVCQTIRALGGRHGAGQGHGQCWGTKAVCHNLGPEPLKVYIFHSTCVNGTLMCPHLECPVLGPWSAWSECSAVCGGGTMMRHRSCEEHPEGVPCQALDLQQWQECNPQACPECPPGQVLSTCATLCPSSCSHLWPGTICVREPCQLGCGCPGGQVSVASGFWFLWGRE